MSKYIKYGNCEFASSEMVVNALIQLGWKPEQIEVHETAQHLYGYHGDKRPETANIIVRRKHVGGLSNDLGFVRQPNGTYAPIISEYDLSALRPRLGGRDPLVAFKVARNEQVVQRIAEHYHGAIERTKVGSTNKITVRY